MALNPESQKKENKQNRREFLKKAAKRSTAIAGLATAAHLPYTKPSVRSFFGVQSAYALTTPTTFTLTSSAFENNGVIPAKYTSDGTNVNPPLSWTGVPTGTQSFAITVLDTTNNNWVHWLVYDIPSTITSILENSVPTGALQGMNGYEVNQYNGPCGITGSGVHYYTFTIWALSTAATGLAVGASLAALQAVLAAFGLGSAILTGTYNLGD